MRYELSAGEELICYESRAPVINRQAHLSGISSAAQAKATEGLSDDRRLRFDFRNESILRDYEFYTSRRHTKLMRSCSLEYIRFIFALTFNHFRKHESTQVSTIHGMA